MVAIVAVTGVAGYFVFSNATDSAESHVDAIVVLGGEHDGREGYALGLARRGIAPTVVLSNPYRAADPVMRKSCLQKDGVEVLCIKPDPPTTRGEAIMTRRLAVERNWKSVLVLSWRFHLPRARLIFSRCLSNIGVSTVAKAVPRQYSLPVWYWEYIYFYQFAGIAKAITIDDC
ncbi:YdcF family protein [Mycobacterium scrofulaceum]|uniref:YdcF family protein n=1 Tax=Mycobacterium scrofulaceum TaxID=1783 RepID=UPI001E654F96|nr:YdcF family protein [Mycobacterium scrofulaceum]